MPEILAIVIISIITLFVVLGIFPLMLNVYLGFVKLTAKKINHPYRQPFVVASIIFSPITLPLVVLGFILAVVLHEPYEYLGNYFKEFKALLKRDDK